MNYYCNPLNIEYKYQFFEREGMIQGNREAADPSVVLFKGVYYLFVSMSGGFYASQDLINWKFHKFNQEMPIYDYAPDVRVIGEYLYFTASKSRGNPPFYHTKDPINEIFEKVEGSFSFFDPNLFEDEDGRIYFYWGCSNLTPIYGVELEKETMKQLGTVQELIFRREEEFGFDRRGNDYIPPKTPEMIEESIKQMLKHVGVPSLSILPKEKQEQVISLSGNNAFIEGAWMTKYKDVYYLQYAASGTQYNTYADVVYQAKNPLGPFTIAKSNPFSYKPGGFIRGAGHGSTVEDKGDKWWHFSTMAISINHDFERRVGMWKSGFDQEGEMFCNQRYGDWPIRFDGKPWETPDWMLLSYGKQVNASSGENALYVTDENIQTWWTAITNKAGEWIEIDLGEECEVHAIQINFADEQLKMDLPKEVNFVDGRIIDEVHQNTRWVLEGSMDGQEYFVIEDKSSVDTDLPHDLILNESGYACRYVKLVILELPYNQKAHISGLRIFGKQQGSLPTKVSNVITTVQGELDLLIRWEGSNAIGYNILWGHQPDKLYHSYMVYGKMEQQIGALMKGESLWVRIDAFNGAGIIEGEVQEVK